MPRHTNDNRTTTVYTYKYFGDNDILFHKTERVHRLRKGGILAKDFLGALDFILFKPDGVVEGMQLKQISDPKLVPKKLERTLRKIEKHQDFEKFKRFLALHPVSIYVWTLGDRFKNGRLRWQLRIYRVFLDDDSLRLETYLESILERPV